MVRSLIPALGLMVLLASCSSLKPLQFSNNSNNNKAPAENAVSRTSATPAGKDVRFLEDISVDQQASIVNVKKEAPPRKHSGTTAAHTPSSSDVNAYLNRNASVEKATPLQLKYAVLLNIEVEELSSSEILEYVDEWYGTPYRLGGNTKKGIDCSAFVQAVYLSAFALSLPRTARDQYKTSRLISATELKEGDLVFFNTRGGVSHVGIYLQNNKFIHASTSQGVTVSDLFDPYYMKRYIGAGRIEK